MRELHGWHWAYCLHRPHAPDAAADAHPEKHAPDQALKKCGVPVLRGTPAAPESGVG